MRRFGRPIVLAGFAALFVIGTALVLLGGRSSAKDRFIDDAAEVCDASKARVDAASEALLGTDPSRAQVEAFLAGAFADELRDRLVRLRAIEVPGGEVEAFAELVAAYSDVVDAVAADPATAAAGADPFAAIDARLDEYGLPECGSEPPG